MKKDFTCRDYKYFIQDFLKENLDNDSSAKLLKHINHCDECKGEMRAQFLVFEGLKRLESGTGFNLYQDFEVMLENRSVQCSRINTARRIFTTVFVVLVALAVLVLLKGVIY